MRETSPGRAGGLPAALSATLLTQVMASWSALGLAAVAPAVAASFDLPPVLIGYQIGLIYTVATILSVLAGGLITRFGAARVSQLSLLALALGVGIASLPTLPAIALASLTIGFAYGLTNPSASHLLARHAGPRNRSLVFSLKQTGVPLGGVAAGLVTPWVAVAFGWQAAIALIAPIALGLALAIAPLRPDWDHDRTPRAPIGRTLGADLGMMVRHPTLRWLCLCGFFYAGIQLCLMAFIVTLAVTELGFGIVAAGTLLATVQVAGVVGRIWWGWLADRLGRNGLVLTAIGGLTLLCCLGVALLAADTPPVMVFGLASLFGATAVGWNGVYMAEVVRHVPPGRIGAATGIATAATFAGVMAGPPGFVLLYGLLGGYGAAYAALAVPAALGALAAGRCARQGAAAA